MIRKRLEAGTFRLAAPPPEGATHVANDAAAFLLLLEGIELEGATHRKRYGRSAALDADVEAERQGRFEALKATLLAELAAVALLAAQRGGRARAGARPGPPRRCGARLLP